ncbi:MAG: prenyltransferase/squalene oxidase repeat-containing protein [Candidatus Paceibacterota bacterium]
MKKNIVKKIIVLFSLSFVLFGFNSALATDAPAPVAINLKVYSGDTVLFNGHLTVTACAESLAIDAPVTVNGKCAVEQSGLPNTWTWNYAPSGWLDSLGGYTTTPDFSKSWGWFNNLNYGNVALNQHILSNGEELLLTYNSFPLRISASKSSGVVGDTITFTAEEESTFDASYNMVWTKSLDTTITLGTQSCITIADGTCSIVLDKAGAINTIGNKALYVPSNNLSIEVSEPVHHSSGGSYIIKQPLIEEKIKEKTFSIENALKFLEVNENVDGSFNSPLYTDWVAVGIAGTENKIIKEKLIKYYKENNLESNLVTDNERRAMALMALGINPYNGTKINYIEKIVRSFDGEQFGDKTGDNDDIFALIVLRNAGYNEKDEIIVKDINYLLSKQASDGSYGSVDMTGATLQALRDFKDIKGVDVAISKGEGYLIAKQEKDGGFGNSFSTAWVLQAMPHNEQILKAESYLASKQDKDGGMETVDTDANTRIWATSYAIPAILHKSWNEILKVSPRQGLGENKTDEVKKINKEIIKKSAKSLEDRAKIENLIENNKLPQNNKIQSKASRVWGILKAPFSWLLDKLSF